MKVLHVTPHLGGGVGKVILDWVRAEDNGHAIICLDYVNNEAERFCRKYKISVLGEKPFRLVSLLVEQADIVVVHYWDHPTLHPWLTCPLPPCRLIFWCHKNYPVPQKEVEYPDLFLDTSPIQGHGQYIWSTHDMTPFSMITPQEHDGFIVGYIGTVDYKKLHKDFLEMCQSINISNAHFIIIGENNIEGISDKTFTFVGHVADVVPYLSLFDVFGYPLRPDHYGTCEQVLGEAMCAGVVPIVMDNPAERKIIDETKHGIIEKSKLDYTLGIEELALCRKLREKLSKRIRITAKTYYSLTYMRQQWARVFNMLSKQPKEEKRGL